VSGLASGGFDLEVEVGIQALEGALLNITSVFTNQGPLDRQVERSRNHAPAGTYAYAQLAATFVKVGQSIAW
jgi:hypothetical protein